MSYLDDDLSANYLQLANQPVASANRDAIILRADKLLPDIRAQIKELEQSILLIEDILAEMRPTLSRFDDEKKCVDSKVVMHEHLGCDTCGGHGRTSMHYPLINATSSNQLVVDGKLLTCIKKAFGTYSSALKRPCFSTMTDRNAYTEMIDAEATIAQMPARIMWCVGNILTDLVLHLPDASEDERKMNRDINTLLTSIRKIPKLKSVNPAFARDFGIKPSGWLGGVTGEDREKLVQALKKRVCDLEAEKKELLESRIALHKKAHEVEVQDVIRYTKERLDEAKGLRKITIDGATTHHDEVQMMLQMHKNALRNILAVLSGA